MSLSLSHPTSFSLCLVLFSKQGSLYRKLCILEAFRKAKSRFPVGATAAKKKEKKNREEEGKRSGGFAEEEEGGLGSVISKPLEKKQAVISLPSPRHFRPPVNTSETEDLLKKIARGRDAQPEKLVPSLQRNPRRDRSSACELSPRHATHLTSRPARGQEGGETLTMK